MAKAFSGKKPQHFGNTIRVFLNYLGRHKFMLGLVGVLTAVSALANLLGTYMIKPVVNGILETGSIPGLVRGVALTAARQRPKQCAAPFGGNAAVCAALHLRRVPCCGMCRPV